MIVDGHVPYRGCRVAPVGRNAAPVPRPDSYDGPLLSLLQQRWTIVAAIPSDDRTEWVSRLDSASTGVMCDGDGVA